MRLPAIAVSLATVTAAVAATVVVAATPAAASPTGCNYSLGGYTAFSSCTGGTGEHRVKVVQRHLQYGDTILLEGPWKPVGQTSAVNLTPHRTERVWVETR